MEKVKLSDHFTYSKLIRFAMPSIMIAIVSSVYFLFDGYFVSNFAGKNAFAAINLISPLVNILCSPVFMIRTGGSALIAKVLGEGNKDKANEYFSMFIFVIRAIGIVLGIFGYIFMRPLAYFIGATDNIIDDCVIFGKFCSASNVMYMLQTGLSTLAVVAEKASLGLVATILSGITRVFFDWLFIKKYSMGTLGASSAMVLSNIVGMIIPLVYFSRENDSLLRLTKTNFSIKVLGKAMLNGSSEMMSNLSMSLVGALYNLQLMRIAQENGVAAYGVIMYVNFIFTSFFFGYRMGINPVTGYHYGRENKYELKNILKRSLVIITAAGISMTALALLLTRPICKIYVGYDDTLMQMSVQGMMIYSLSFLFMGYNIFGSGFFTGLNNGPVSRLISFLRTCVLQIACIYILPVFWGLNGMWAAIIVAELLTLFVTAGLLVTNRKKYGY